MEISIQDIHGRFTNWNHPGINRIYKEGVSIKLRTHYYVSRGWERNCKILSIKHYNEEESTRAPDNSGYLFETILLSTNNMGFGWEIREFWPLQVQFTPFICSPASTRWGSLFKKQTTLYMHQKLSNSTNLCTRIKQTHFIIRTLDSKTQILL